MCIEDEVKCEEKPLNEQIFPSKNELFSFLVVEWFCDESK